jgi:hypothetical protein
LVFITAAFFSIVLASLSLEMMQRLYKVLLPALLIGVAGLAIPDSILLRRVPVTQWSRGTWTRPFIGYA